MALGWLVGCFFHFYPHFLFPFRSERALKIRSIYFPILSFVKAFAKANCHGMPTGHICGTKLSRNNTHTQTAIKSAKASDHHAMNHGFFLSIRGVIAALEKNSTGTAKKEMENYHRLKSRETVFFYDK